MRVGLLMREFLPPGHGRLALRLCAAGAISALLAGCSTDSTRLSDPFSNPFATSSNEPVQHVASSATIPAGRSPPVTSHALPASNNLASAAPLRPNLTSRGYGAPISRETTGSIESGPTRVARGAASGGWTSTGGVPITVGEGETVDVLSKRYGVPPTALLQTNGLGSASELRPGASIVVPVYNAVAAAQQSSPAHATEVTKPRMATIERHPQRVAEAVGARPAPLRAPPPTQAPKIAQAKPLAKAVEVRTAKAVAGKPVIEAAAPKGTPGKVVADKAAPASVQSVKSAGLKPPAAKVGPVRTASLAPTAAPAAEAAPAKVDPAPTANAAPAASAADTSGNPEFRWPARGRIIQGFKGGNDGINIAVPEGTAVKAAENGTVAYAGNELKGYGNLVLIRHPNGFVTAYANNGELDVKRGDQVKRGQTIAKSGQSGNVASPQLHFELRKGSTPVDPTSYLAGL